jgi:hypothetical protein
VAGRTLDRDLARLAAIELLHADDLAEGDVVAVLEPMPRLVEAGDHRVVVILDLDNHARQRLLACRIDTCKCRPKVVEDRAVGKGGPQQ